MPETYETYSRTQPALVRIGQTIYWITTASAILYIILGLAIVSLQPDPGWWLLFWIFVPAPAFVVWLCGRVLKYLFSGL